jgi:translocation protein SEC72
MAAAEGPETFVQLPLTIDPDTKAISAPANPVLASHLDELNLYNRYIVALETPNQNVPPPAPVNPKRSVQIGKLRESGNAAFKKGTFSEAVKMYDLAIKMALDRPPWEASGLVREELSALHGNRAQALMGLQEWPEAALDAKISAEMKRVGNVKGWWRRGQCLKEMGRLVEARDWLRQGVEFERGGPEKGNIGELEGLLRDVEEDIKEKGI